MSIRRSLVTAVMLLTVDVYAAHALPVFKGALGVGAETVGGSGRHVTPPDTKILLVRTLDDSGKDSLRECAEAKGARTCLFEVSGSIRLKKEIRVSHPFLTISGESAPSPGIEIRGAGIGIEADHVLIRHLRIHVGDNPDGPPPDSRDGVRIGREKSHVRNVVIDHLTVAWALDENGSTAGEVRGATVSNSIFAEGLDKSIHPKGPHSKGFLIGDGAKEISFIGNLFAHNVERNPYIKPGAKVQFLNNVVFGWAGTAKSALCNLTDNADLGLPIFLDFAGNTYLQAPYSKAHAPVWAKRLSEQSKIFVGNNSGPTRQADSEDPWKAVDLPMDVYRASQANFASTTEIAQPPQAAKEQVLNLAGARPWERDGLEKRIVFDVVNGTGKIKDCIEGCTSAAGPWPAYTSQKRALKLPDRPLADDDANGYTNLEDFLVTLERAS